MNPSPNCTLAPAIGTARRDIHFGKPGLLIAHNVALTVRPASDGLIHHVLTRAGMSHPDADAAVAAYRDWRAAQKQTTRRRRTP